MDETRLSCEQCGQFNECKYYEHRNAQSHICNNFRYNNDVVKALEKRSMMEIEFTDEEKEMLKWAFNTLTSIVELNKNTDSDYGFDKNDVFCLAEKLGIDY